MTLCNWHFHRREGNGRRLWRILVCRLRWRQTTPSETRNSSALNYFWSAPRRAGFQLFAQCGGIGNFPDGKWEGCRPVSPAFEAHVLPYRLYLLQSTIMLLACAVVTWKCVTGLRCVLVIDLVLKQNSSSSTYSWSSICIRNDRMWYIQNVLKIWLVKNTQHMHWQCNDLPMETTNRVFVKHLLRQLSPIRLHSFFVGCLCNMQCFLT